MSEQHYSEKGTRKAMADQPLAEDAKKQAEEKQARSLMAAGIAAPRGEKLITYEKLKELFQSRERQVDASELSDVLDAMDLDSEQMDYIYDSLGAARHRGRDGGFPREHARRRRACLEEINVIEEEGRRTEHARRQL